MSVSDPAHPPTFAGAWSYRLTSCLGKRHPTLSALTVADGSTRRTASASGPDEQQNNGKTRSRPLALLPAISRVAK